jgi:hypothetical protein
MLPGKGNERYRRVPWPLRGSGMRAVELGGGAVLAMVLLWGGAALAQEREVQCQAVTGNTQHGLSLTLGGDGVVTAFDYWSLDRTNSKRCSVHAAKGEGENEEGQEFSLDWKTRPDGTVRVELSEPNSYTAKVVGTATISRRNGAYRFSLEGNVPRFCEAGGESEGGAYLAPVATLTPGQAACRLENGAPGQVRADAKAATARRMPHPYDPATDPPPPYEFAVVGIRAYYYHQETGVAGGEDLAQGKTAASIFGDEDGPSGATWVLVDLERRPAQRTPVQQLLLTAQVPRRMLLRKQVEVGEFFTEKKDRIAVPFLVYGTGCEELKLRAVLSTAGRKQTQVMDGSVPFSCRE